jgi:amidase
MMGAMTSALAQAAAVRDGSVTATELVEAALEAIGRRADLNAFVTLCGERALAEAAQVRPGDARPLCGVPVGIKDLMAPTEGVRTTHGSAAFGDWVPDHDAPHVARLRAAGAIVVGKTNTPELGLRPVTEPLRWGPTRNPRDTRLSPGGSSGGSAAAVAAGLVPLCDGSDFGGSIRIPAACCGVVGYKPSAGLVPGEPELDALEGSRVGAFGAIAQSVRDVAAALGIMAARGFDAMPATVGVPVRVALSPPDGLPVAPEPLAAARRAADLLADLGHDVREAAPDWDDDDFVRAWEVAGGAATGRLVDLLARWSGSFDPQALEPASRAWLVDGPPIPADAYAWATGALERFAHRILDPWPEGSVLVTPTLTRLPVEVQAMQSRPGVSQQATRFSVFLRVFNVTGQPAITIPVGDMTGVQIVAAPGRDDLVLSVGAQLERALR